MAIVLAGLSVLLVAGAVRLSMGPVSVSFLNDYIERGLNDENGQYSVRLGETIVTWAGWERTFDILARDVHVTGADGAEQAYIPELSIALSMRALLVGRAAPTQLEVFGPRITIVRRPDGHFALGEELTAPGVAPDPSRPKLGAAFSEQFVTRLVGPPDRVGPLGYLRSFIVNDAELTIDDQRSGLLWRAPTAHIVLFRDAEGLGGNARLEIETGGERTVVDVAGSYDRSAARIEIETRFDVLRPDQLASLSSALEPLSGLGVPLKGRLRLRIGTDGAVDSVSMKASVGKGRVALDGVLPEPVAVTSGLIEAEARGGLAEVDLKTLALDIAGTPVRLSGAARRENGAVKASLRFSAGKLRLADARRLWPVTAAKGGRAWIFPNVRRGHVDGLTVSADLTVPMGEDGAFGEPVVDKLDGGFRFEGIDIHYLRPLPPVTNVSGKATIGADSLEFAISRGRLGALSVDEGKIRIYDLNNSKQMLSVEAVARGPVRAAVKLLEHPRLDLVKRLGLGSDAVGGRMATRLVVRLPLLAKLTFDEIDIGAAANLRGASVKKAALGADLTDGDLTLQIDKRGMDVNGKIRLGGVAAALQWRENFYADARYTGSYAVKGWIDGPGRRRLGFDAAPYVTGPLGFDVIYTTYADGRAGASGTLDVNGAALDVAELGWKKTAEVPGFLRFTALLKDERLRAVRDIALQAGDMDAQGSVEFAADGKSLKSVSFSKFAYGRTDIRIEGVARPDGVLALSVAGSALDLRPLLAASAEEGPKRPLAIDVALDKVFIGKAAPPLAPVRGSLERGTGDWLRVDLRGGLPEKGGLELSVTPVAGGREVSLRSDNAGRALAVVGISENVVGGQLTIRGRFDDTKAMSPLKANAEIKTFRVVRGPFLAKILQVASLTGILDVLRGRGISFSRLEMPAVMTGNVIEVGESRAYGSAVGITAKGWVDIGKEELDLEGTVVPAYSLNAVFGNIPLLGPLLTGEKGSGVFAATYRMRGKLADPNVSVNPLATLAPGFLRNLFQIFDSAPTKAPVPGGGAEPDKAPDEPKQAPIGPPPLEP